MTERKIVEREPVVWIDEGVQSEPDRGNPVTYFARGAGPCLVYPRDSRPMLSGREALAEFFVDQLGADGARIFLGVWNNGRPRDIWGVALRAQFIDGQGKASRYPTPGALEGKWRSQPLGDFAYVESGGPTFVFSFKPVQGEMAIAVAGPTVILKLAESWLHGFGLPPEEYAPGRWRGGLVVQPVDVLAPIAMPRREDLACPILIDRHGDTLTTELLIREAARIEAPPPVEIPPRISARERGPLGKLLQSLGGK